MAFQFNPELYEGKAKNKYLEAKKRIMEIHNKFPDIKKADEYLNYLKREYHYFRVGIFNKGEESALKKEDLKKEIEDLEKLYFKLLDKYNIPHNYKEPRWDCSICEDKGYIYKDGHYQICTCSIGKEMQRRRNMGKLPRHLYNAKFKTAQLDYYSETLKTDKGISFRENAQLIYSYAQSFAKNFSIGKNIKGLIIEGPVGSGKSYLLACIANQLISREISFKYIVYLDLLEEIRDTYNNENYRTEKELIDEVQNTPVLLIDDLGTEKLSEFTATILYQIIDKRYREERPIILASNYKISELKNRFEEMAEEMGERIFQRLIEMNRYVKLYGNLRAKIVEEQQGVSF